MPRGRPREFDADQVLDRVMRVFWARGYEGTSLDDLETATGLNRPSLYAAFGNKEALFRAALERYERGPACYFADALARPTARAVVEALFAGALAAMAKKENPRGCLAVQGALACSPGSGAIQETLARFRDRGVGALRKRFRRAVAEGDLPRGTEAAALARYVATVLNGLSVQAAGGASRRELATVVDLALRAWPKAKRP